MTPRIACDNEDEPRGRLQQTDPALDETNTLEARALALAGELRTLPEAERTRIVTRLAKEAGLTRIFARAGARKKSTEFPEKAPEAWSQRTNNRRESPADFILRVYGRWIRKGFARPDLRRLDAPLYQAFAKWIERHPVPAKLEKFAKETRTTRVERELKELNIREPADAYVRLPDDFRRANRLYRAALRRQPPSRLPKTAPKLWNADARREHPTAIAFLESVYAPWLSAGLNLTYIREIDRSLYQTLAKWYERHKQNVPQHLADFFQARKSKRSIEVEEELTRFNIENPRNAYERFPNDRKRADRLYQAALRRLTAT
jgi:hypothetical protein